MIPNLRSLRFRPNLYRPDGQGFWSGHLPFAADIIEALKPSTLVELGTHHGESYFGFCQAISESSQWCRCYAVDTWEGDVHTGRYPSSVFESVTTYNASHYMSFSNLLRMTFDEAARLFLDASVDLLHIDGSHSYAAVKHDFDTWLPKVAQGGLILMHDIAVQREDFGVWRLWDEIAHEFPSFAFWHSCGLGVLVNGDLRRLDHPLLAALFNGESDPQPVRDYYLLCAECLSHEPLSKSQGISKFQVYSPDESGYSHVRSHVASVRLNDWVALDLDVPFPSARLRVDPCERASLIEISEITVQDSATGDLLWCLDPARPGEIDYGGTAVWIPGNDLLTIVSFGNDPQLFLPSFDVSGQLETLRLKCRLRIDPGFSSAAQAFKNLATSLSQARIDSQESQRRSDELRASLADATEKLQQEQQRHEEHSGEWAVQGEALEGEANSLRASLADATEKLHQEQQRHEKQASEWAAEREALKAEANGLRVSVANATAALREERHRNGEQRAQDQFALASAETRSASMQRTVESMRNSKSWRLTAPLRLLGGAALKAHQLVLKALYQSPAFPFTGKLLAKAVYAGRLPGANLLLPPNPLFASDFYAISNPDVSRTTSQWAHYVGFGADERRNPHPMFDTRYYMARNPDVVQSGLNPLIHYYSFGAFEFRQPHPEFDSTQYLRLRGDVRVSGMNPLLHYWEYGRHEQAPLNRGGCADPDIAREQTTELPPEVSISPDSPLISVILPVFNTPDGILRRAIESVRSQSYPRWQLCIYDDGSSREETLSVLREYSVRGDSRIDIQFGTGNSGISRASNAALDQALGDYIGMLDHDDELDPNALSEIAARLQRDPSLDVIYTDQDTIDERGNRIRTAFKPDWSPELFRGVMFVNHLLVVRAALIRRAGGFDQKFDRIQDFELMLRVSEKTDKIVHVPQILYHWRSLPGSVAASENAKGELESLQAAAVNAHLKRLGIAAIASPHASLPHRLTIRPATRSIFPRVVIAIREGDQPSTNLTARSILNHSSYSNLALAVPPSLSRGLPADGRISVAPLEETHARLAPGDFLVWIDNGIEVVSGDWIEHLLMYCEQPDVGCASAVIRFNEEIWCAGLMLGRDQKLGPSMRGFPAESDGYMGSLSCARETFAISGECLMISASVFRDLGGSVKYYSKSFFDGADLAFRARASGRRNIVTPQALVRKTQAVVPRNGWNLDESLFCDRWESLMQKGDPYWSQNALAEFSAVASVAAGA